MGGFFPIAPFEMKVVASYQHDPLSRQCREAIEIKEVYPKNRINNKEEYHQPGEVQIRYEKNVSDEFKKRKQISKEAKKKRLEDKSIECESNPKFQEITNDIGHFTTCVKQI